ncbi:MAG: hypothetical protein L0Y71_03635 [Gemmataceae bacterium]|nr:hypothetical protein [Gemmataceae bacterium]
MEPQFLITLAARWLHILSASLAIGVPIYVRFVLMPALAQLDETQRAAFRETLHSRWRIFVHVMIVVFLATGFWTFLGAKRWSALEADAKFRYHLFFGIKLIIALAMFFISSALAGRSAALAGMRTNAKMWLGVLIVLGLAVVGIAGVMRFMDAPRSTTTPAAVSTS